MSTIMSRCYILLSICMFYGYSFSFDDNDNDNEIDENDYLRYETCVDKYLQKDPHIGDRFSLYQLTKQCKRVDNWNKGLDLHLNHSELTNYTTFQQKYINRIQYCRNYDDCYGDTMSHRKIAERLKTKHKRQTRGAVRRECRTLSVAELQNYFDTLNLLKNSVIDSTSKYDLIIAYHLPTSAPEAHFGPAFLPYHRELLKQLEVAGRRENPSFSLCYWDSTLDHGLPNAADSVLWMDSFFGNGNGDVTTGPFANWPTTAVVPGSGKRLLFRRVGRSSAGNMYNADDIARLMTKDTYEEFCSYCVDPTFELLHAGVHDFVGGFMTYIHASPNDPVFFNHHCFIDYFWETWRQTKQDSNERQTDYPPDGRGACASQHYANSPLKPFDMRVIQGLSESYNSLYTYVPSPTCANGCTGPFLFCNTDNNKCMSKVRPGGMCNGLENFDSCFNSVCNGARCVGISEGRGNSRNPMVPNGNQQSIPNDVIPQNPVQPTPPIPPKPTIPQRHISANNENPRNPFLRNRQNVGRQQARSNPRNPFLRVQQNRAQPIVQPESESVDSSDDVDQ